MKINKNMSNRDILNGLEKMIELENKSEGTCVNYTRDIKQLMSYYGNKESIARLTEDDLMEYALYLHHKKYSPRTYNGKIASMRYVYGKVLFREINFKKIPLKKVKKKAQSMPTTEEVKEIINACEDFELKCMIYLGIGCGLRASEIARIKTCYINSKGHEMFVLGKGSRQRYTIISEELIQELRKYYVKYREKIEGNEYLFAKKNKKGHIDSVVIGKRFSDLMKKIGYPEYTIHSLRRYFATVVYMDIKDYEYLTRLMGHDTLETTRDYVNVFKLDREIKTPVSTIILESKGIVKNDNPRNN